MPRSKWRVAEGLRLIRQASNECRTALRIFDDDPKAANELYLQAARSCYIAETVRWKTELDVLQELLQELAARLGTYESNAVSSDEAQTAIPVGRSGRTTVLRPELTR